MKSLQQLIEENLNAIHQDAFHDLKPIQRLAIYDSVPTSESKLSFFQIQLDILATKKVVPIWEESLLESGVFDGEPLTDLQLRTRLNSLMKNNYLVNNKAELLHTLNFLPIDRKLLRDQIVNYTQSIKFKQSDPIGNEQNELLYLVDMDRFYQGTLYQAENKISLYNQTTSVKKLPNRLLLDYLLYSADQFLHNKITLQTISAILDELHIWLGSYLGAEEKKFPGQASWAGFTAYRTLAEVYGSTYSNATFRKEALAFKDNTVLKTTQVDAALCSARAYAYDYTYNTNKRNWIPKVNSQRNLEFWKWWLTEAIPQAWELAQQFQ